MFSFLKKVKKRPRCAALVAAAGSSSRMGGVNKLLEDLDGMPVLVRTLTWRSRICAIHMGSASAPRWYGAARAASIP